MHVCLLPQSKPHERIETSYKEKNVHAVVRKRNVLELVEIKKRPVSEGEIYRGLVESLYMDVQE